MTAKSRPAIGGVVLDINDIHTYYGNIHALQGVSMQVREHEIVTLLGSNGAGKSTTLRTISGILRPRSGAISLRGKRIDNVAAHDIVRLGVCQSPEGRHVFPRLTVDENLDMGAFIHGDSKVADDRDRVLTLFPRLRERLKQRAGTLSGGEQQMLAIGRALVTNPQLLLLDEPTEGLAPVIVDRLVSLIAELRAEGLAMILVEQSLDVCVAVADRMMILDDGHIVWEGNGDELMQAKDIRARHLTLEQA